MEAYKVLNKDSTRQAYDAEIAVTQQPNYSYHNPYYATHRRDRKFYEGDYAGYQEHMYRTRYDSG